MRGKHARAPPLDEQPEPLKTKSLKLPNRLIRLAVKYGNGSFTMGIRDALEEKEKMQNIPSAILQMLLTRNLQNDMANFNAFDQAFTAAVTPEQREFVRANWMTLKPFIQGEVGKIALQTFIEDWRDSLRPAKTAVKPPEP